MLQLNPITVNEDYRKKWNITSTDFLLLCNDKGEPIRDTLYRKGALGGDLKADYFMIIKHVEAHYSREILEMSKSGSDGKHLQSNWVIIDKHGVEKVVFESYNHGYLAGGLLYTYKDKMYNIETGECYGEARTTMKSKDFVFIHNAYDKDKTKRGVLKINKKDGTFELFPEE